MLALERRRRFGSRGVEPGRFELRQFESGGMHVSNAPVRILAFALVAASGSGCDRLGSAPQYVGAWERVASSPIARVEAPAAGIDGRLYVFGGFDAAALTVSRRVDILDLESATWSRGADLPLEVTHVVAAPDGTRVWFAGGYLGRHPGTPVRDVIAYDTAGDRWIEGPPLPEARAGGALALRGRSLHFFGGFVDRNATSGSHWELDLDAAAPSWVERAPLPEPRGHLGAAVIGDRIYAIGGQFNHDDGREDVDFVHVYEPAADRWKALAPLPTPRSHVDTATVVLDGRIAIFGGRNDSPRSLWQRPQRLADFALRAVTVYDPETNAWSERAQLPMGLLGPSVGLVGDRVVVVGGSVHMTAFPQDDAYVAPARALLLD